MKRIRSFSTFEETVKLLTKTPKKELTQADIDAIAAALDKRSKRKEKRKNGPNSR